MEIQGSERHLLGNSGEPPGIEVRVLTSRDVSSLVIDSLCERAGGQNVAVACFYFDFATQQEQSLTGVLGTLLKQLAAGLGELPEEMVQAYEAQKSFIGGRRPQHTKIVEMLHTASSKKRTFICIDALDEYEPEHRVKLLNSLNKILQKSPNIRLFVTGRPHIGPEIGECLAGRVTSLRISTKRDDITRYLHSKLEDDTTPDAMNSSLGAEILKKIPEEVSEMYVAKTLGEATLSYVTHGLTDTSRFLLVSLSIGAVLQETTIHRRRQKLSAMANGLGLGDAYSATLSRIKGQGGEKARLGIAALMWISHSERPLKADELCHALAVEIGSPNLNSENIPSTSTILACCQGLVVAEKEASTVRLIHFTLQEYLRAHPELFGPAHSIMAETCLSYLNSQQVKTLSTSPSALHDTPFLGYSSLYWGVHAKRDLSGCAKQLALELFDDCGSHVPTKILLQAQRDCIRAFDFDKISLFSDLHYASFFGIIEIVASLVAMESCDINKLDCGGNTPLAWASRNGHEEVVNMLLRRDDINPDKQDNDGRTPLFGAAYNRHEGVVKILLERGEVNPDKPDNDGRTPLFGAACNGHESVVKILLERGGVSPNKPDNDGQTPLWWAAHNGHEGVVKILLGRNDISPDKPDNDGRTPLWWAARSGYEGMVKILLGRNDIDPDKSDNKGQTPLWIAAYWGNDGVVKILLERDGVSPDKPDNDGRTPLWWAARSGYEGMVKILLRRNDINPDKLDNKGRTPLWIAASEGREGVVKTLLRRNDINPDKPNINGRTPLWWAARDGHEGVVKMLLARDVSPAKPDRYGQTPLFWAVENGHKGVIALLQHPESAAPGLP